MVLLNLDVFDSVDSITADVRLLDNDNSADIIARFPGLFDDKVGLIPNVKCQLELKPGAQPVYRPPRPVPYALLPHVNAELDRLERDGVIRIVDYCHWGTPLVNYSSF